MRVKGAKLATKAELEATAKKIRDRTVDFSKKGEGSAREADARLRKFCGRFK